MREKLLHYLRHYIKPVWEFGDITDDGKRIAREFNLKEYKLGWNVINKSVELWSTSKRNKWYCAASFNFKDYSYGRLYKHLKQCEYNDRKRTADAMKEIEEQNNKIRKDKAVDMAGQCGEYLNSKLTGRVSTYGH